VIAYRHEGQEIRSEVGHLYPANDLPGQPHKVRLTLALPERKPRASRFEIALSIVADNSQSVAVESLEEKLGARIDYSMLLPPQPDEAVKPRVLAIELRRTP
jgi:hypothetical protein